MFRRLTKSALPAFGLHMLSACNGSGALMRIYGYTEILPPSTLLAPGAMVAVESRSPLKVKMVCGPRASLGQHFKAKQSATASRAIKTADNRTFKLSGTMWNMVHSNARFEAVGDITANITNPVIVELDDDDVIANVSHRSEECQVAINMRLARGHKVTMISSALQADVVYQVEWKSEHALSGGNKTEVLKDLAIELGASGSTVSTDCISASGLIWGIRDDEYLARISYGDILAQLLDVRSTQPMLVSEEDAPDFDMEPDAPYLPPPDGWPTPQVSDKACAHPKRKKARPVKAKPKPKVITKTKRKKKEDEEDDELVEDFEDTLEDAGADLLPDAMD